MNFFNRSHRRRRPFFLLLVIALIFGAAALVMLLWNYTLPDLLHAKSISYGQALALLILCKLLFGFGCKPPFPRGGRKEHFRNMSEEDKERLKEEWRQRFKR